MSSHEPIPTIALGNSFPDRVYALALQIPRGKVATYGQLAALLGKPNAARAVGNALHKNPYEGVVPCHRVVNSQGKLACHFGFGGAEEQAIRLRQEGVEVIDNQVDLATYQCQAIKYLDKNHNL